MKLRLKQDLVIPAGTVMTSDGVTNATTRNAAAFVQHTIAFGSNATKDEARVPSPYLCQFEPDREGDAMRFALFPGPERSAGWRLCHVVMGLDPKTYLRSFDRVDLCHPKWSMPAARKKAAELVAERGMDDVIVLCGVQVAAAFGVPPGAPPIRLEWVPCRALSGPRLVLLPHPSGLNRFWQRTGVIEKARAVLREVGVLPQTSTNV